MYSKTIWIIIIQYMDFKFKNVYINILKITLNKNNFIYFKCYIYNIK